MIKATFVDLSYTLYDKHHVYYLSSYLSKKGIDVSYINEPSFSKTIKRLQANKPDILLYSAFSKDAATYFNFDKIVKEHMPIKSVMGGPAPTFDISISKCGTIDAFCIGEGEYALEEYLQNGFSRCKNIILNGDEPPKEFYPFIDPDSAPIPLRDIVYEQDSILKIMPSKQFVAGRGCPYNCTYCYNNIANELFRGCGPIVRYKSVDYLFEEIRLINKKYPLKNVVFNDETFIINKKWFLEFADRFPREIGLNYSCYVRADLLNEEIAEALKKSGCISANWSIESGNDYIRNKILKRNMKTEKILETGRLLHKHRIPQKIGNMIGLPGESFNNMLETLEVNMLIKPRVCLANVFVPFPSLELTNYALENNHLKKEKMKDRPLDYFGRTCLEFSNEEKDKIQKLSYLFQILVDYPILFRNKAIFGTLFKINLVILRLLFEFYFLYKHYKQFNIKAQPSLSFRIALRHFKNAFSLNKYSKVKSP